MWNLRDSGDRWSDGSDDYLPEANSLRPAIDLICSKWAKLEKRAKMFLPHPRVKEEMCVSWLCGESGLPHSRWNPKMGTVSPVGNSSLKSGLPPLPWCSLHWATVLAKLCGLVGTNSCAPQLRAELAGIHQPEPEREAKYMMVLRRWCYVNENFKTLKWKYSTI